MAETVVQVEMVQTIKPQLMVQTVLAEAVAVRLGMVGYSSASGAGGDGVVIVRISTEDYNTIVAVGNITGTYTATATGSDTYIKWTASGTLVT